MCPVTVDGRVLLASGSDDRTLRLCDPASGRQERRLEGHTGGVYTVCPVTVDGRVLLASGGNDRTVRLWDITTGSIVLQIPVHHPANSGVQLDGTIVVGLSAGVLAVELNAETVSRMCVVA
jgi:WD40 repeat protein